MELGGVVNPGFSFVGPREPLTGVWQVFDVSTLYFINLPVSRTESSGGEEKGLLPEFKRLSRIWVIQLLQRLKKSFCWLSGISHNPGRGRGMGLSEDLYSGVKNHQFKKLLSFWTGNLERPFSVNSLPQFPQLEARITPMPDYLITGFSQGGQEKSCLVPQ